MTDFTLTQTVSAPYDATLRRVRDLLADAGFGVLLADVADEARRRLSGMMKALATDPEDPDATRA